MAKLSRAEAKVFFGSAGHLVHYDAMHYDAIESVETLIQLVSDIQRGEAPADARIVAGDGVRLVGDLSQLNRYSEELLRETVFVVRYVGDDGTVDRQPGLVTD